MKKYPAILSIALSLLSAPAFATGGFDCMSDDHQLGVSGNVSGSYGKALTRDPEFQIFGEKKSIRAAQYKNTHSELYVLAVEDYDDGSGDFKQRTVGLAAKVDAEKGTATGEMYVKIDGRKTPARNVTCTLE
jgi:hypothetical protein